MFRFMHKRVNSIEEQNGRCGNSQVAIFSCFQKKNGGVKFNKFWQNSIGKGIARTSKPKFNMDLKKSTCSLRKSKTEREIVTDSQSYPSL